MNSLPAAQCIDPGNQRGLINRLHHVILKAGGQWLASILRPMAYLAADTLAPNPTSLHRNRVRAGLATLQCLDQHDACRTRYLGPFAGAKPLDP